MCSSHVSEEVFAYRTHIPCVIIYESDAGTHVYIIWSIHPAIPLYFPAIQTRTLTHIKL